MSPFRDSFLRAEKCSYLGWHCESCALPCGERPAYVIEVDEEIEACFSAGMSNCLNMRESSNN